MNYSFLLLLFWFVPVERVVGQVGYPSTLSVQTDSAYLTLDSTQFQLLEDPTGQLTFAQVRHSSDFQPGTHYAPDRQAHTFWVRMRIRNELSKNLRVYYSNINSDYADVYWLDTARRWQSQRVGDLVPRSQLASYNGYQSSDRVLMVLKPGQQTVIYQRSTSVWWHLPPQRIYPQIVAETGLWKAIFTHYVVKRERLSYWFEGIVIGILLLAVGYNLLIYKSTKEKVYLYFGLCLLFYVLDRNSSTILTALFNEYPYPFQFVGSFFFLAFFSFFVQTIRRFVQPNAATVWLDKTITISLSILSLVYIIQFALSGWVPSSIAHLHFMLEVLIRLVYGLCLWMTYRVMRQKNTDAWFVFIAITPLALLWSLGMVQQIARSLSLTSLANGLLLPRSFEYSEALCFAWMIIFFSAALVHRYNLTRQQVLQQAVEKEQLEQERARLIIEQNEQLERQVSERTAELQQSLAILRATQDRLVQSEKLASLGELTAGIAHEIQNPLNFVTNFSEVSVELVAELRQEAKGDDQELVEELLDSLKQNLEKIDQHGKRAGAIVRGMLEHSRTSAGERTDTSLNPLVDEYLKLAYYGVRAKDKLFTCQVDTYFDQSLPTLSVAPQEIGRVLLNLFNNAFYAVRERKRKEITGAYQPMIWVQTRFIATHEAANTTGLPSTKPGIIEVLVRDNGMGIPEAIKAKIFQPFFTTKPTGEGTGLGLSLSYDIITKGYGGELLVRMPQEKGTEFVVRLPVK